MSKKVRLLLIGGFLGAGKTTLLNAVAKQLQARGKQVGLITNDQASGLVDTYILSTNNINVQEIAGSCFCCNFNGLMEAALYLKDTRKCDVIVAEPVGSCTDLSATIVQPIKAFYQEYFDLAPLSVLVDPFQLNENLEDENKIKKGSGYIYFKQLEEADHLVINKTDLLDETAKLNLTKLLDHKFADFPVHWISALKGEHIQDWLNALSNDTEVGRRIAKVDYDLYAEGEAGMGWYNATFIVRNNRQLLIPWKEFNIRFIQLFQEVFQHENIVIGHLKTFLKSGASHLKANLIGTNQEISIQGNSFNAPSARLMLNIRAETSPRLLEEIVQDIIEACEKQGIQFETVQLKSLSPGRPYPTYRHDQVVE